MRTETLKSRFSQQLQALATASSLPEYKVYQEHYFADISDEELEELQPEYAAHISDNHWQVAQSRSKGQTLVQIYNPTIEKNGWDSGYTHVDIVTDDRPFLVDSVKLALNRSSLTVHNIFHPIYLVQRHKKQLSSVQPAGTDNAAGLRESYLHFVVDRIIDEAQIKQVSSTILKTIKDVTYVVNDRHAMKQHLEEEMQWLESDSSLLNAADKEEALAFLRWICVDNFILLGSCDFIVSHKGDKTYFDAIEQTKLGILKGDTAKKRDFRLRIDNAGFVKQPCLENIITLTKSALRSTVHRGVHCDKLSIARHDEKGRLIEEKQFWGLYTSVAYRSNPNEIPIVRQKINHVLKKADIDSSTHKGKALLHVLETFPRDELFCITADTLFDFATSVVQLNERQHVKVLVRPDRYERYISCLIYVPRDVYDHKLRKRIANIVLQTFNASNYDFLIKLADEALARIEMLVMLDKPGIGDYDIKSLQQKVSIAAQTWEGKFKSELYQTSGSVKAGILFSRYQHAFPGGYQNHYSAAVAVADVQLLESMSTAQTLGLRVDKSDRADRFHLRLFQRETHVPLSDTLPILENMGVRVLIEHPYQLILENDTRVWMHDYILEYPQNLNVRFEVLESYFKTGFAKIWAKEVENDGLNKLILAAGVSYRDIVALRTCCKYLLQAGLPFSQHYMEATLLKYTDITSQILELFNCRFDPALHSRTKTKTTRQKADQLVKTIHQALDTVASLDHDRILRNYLSVVEATIRTNFYQTSATNDYKTYVSIKLDTSKVMELPDPRPMFEIFVYSPETEGVHLRGGKVARGGLRWSDRREDFRTEILGLMKAQMVKNSVIVPVGAKGGFVMKCPPATEEREALMAKVVNCYTTFIHALLDVTDNIVDTKIKPPQNVVCYDEDDPYLVVAADKGTATFSDMANGIAISRDFWLGDAFASGGSLGYDHKKMGITARGAWESVKLNFRDLGKDIQCEDFTVVGIGDMAGDVFGNGMLLSNHICLIAAFNHMHIFIDPAPDAASSYKERKRLFKLKRSTWQDYNKALISKGGGIFLRSEKFIKLSKQAQEALDIDADKLSPDQLINRILKAPVDLLWNGGIGTYAKASYEQHSDAGDKANDILRINADELRCRCVGEGGNLGFTQQARIEYALNGGRIDTDFIHNAGGVDCSDHEVNIKILLNSFKAAGKLTEAQRVKLLAEMTDDVAEAVLLSNYWQGQAITQVEVLATAKVDQHSRFIHALEKQGRLDRVLESLPDDETLRERKINGQGLVRPEIAVLISYAKLVGFDAIVDSSLWDDPYFADELSRYFPEQIKKRFGKQLHQHQLRQEILATFIINRMVNRMGPTFGFHMQEETGASFSEVTRAYTIAWESFDLRGLWMEMTKLDNKIPRAAQTHMMLEACSLTERASRWLIQNRRKRLGIRETIDDYRQGADALRRFLPQIFSESSDESVQQCIAGLTEQGVTAEMATDVAFMDAYYSTFDIVEISNALKLPLERVTQAYFAISSYMGVFWLRIKIEKLPVDNHWQDRAGKALVDDLYIVLRKMTIDVLKSVPAAKKAMSVQQLLEKWYMTNQADIDRFLANLTEFKNTEHLDSAMLSVAVRDLKLLCSC